VARVSDRDKARAKHSLGGKDGVVRTVLESVIHDTWVASRDRLIDAPSRPVRGGHEGASGRPRGLPAGGGPTAASPDSTSPSVSIPLAART